MPRPELYPVKKVIGFEELQLNAIEKWRRRQTPIPSVSEADPPTGRAGLPAKAHGSHRESRHRARRRRSKQSSSLPVPSNRRLTNPNQSKNKSRASERSSAVRRSSATSEAISPNQKVERACLRCCRALVLLARQRYGRARPFILADRAHHPSAFTGLILVAGRRKGAHLQKDRPNRRAGAFVELESRSRSPAEAGVPTHQDMQISHEAIYRSLFIQTRGVLKKELDGAVAYCAADASPQEHNANSGQGHILDMVSIRERPAEIEDRAVPGHWEGDLLTGANDTHVATLVERNTRFTMLVEIPREDTTTVVAALAKHIGKPPEESRRSLTWDQGKEMHAHKRFTVATNVQVYFCDPRSPWQRGSNENTNGLLRQYFPRGTDFSRISQSYLNAIALRLNQRPRKTLGFQTPADRLQAVLH